jgi:hypothetical protein
VAWYLWGITGFFTGVFFAVSSVTGFSYMLMRNQKLQQRYMSKLMTVMMGRKKKAARK